MAVATVDDTAAPRRSSNAAPVVYVVDDDPEICHAMVELLGTIDLECRTYSTATRFLQDYAPSASDCLVLDIRMPGMSGLELQEKLIEEQATIPIILLTAHGDVEMAVTAMKRGAFDFIEKPVRDQALLESISRAINVSQRWAQQAKRRREIRMKWESLTPREQKVATLVVSGKSNKIIAHTLGVSQRTIEVHRARVMSKMGVKSLATLIRHLLAIDIPEA